MCVCVCVCVCVPVCVCASVCVCACVLLTLCVLIEFQTPHTQYIVTCLPVTSPCAAVTADANDRIPVDKYEHNKIIIRLGDNQSDCIQLIPLLSVFVIVEMMSHHEDCHSHTVY